MSFLYTRLRHKNTVPRRQPFRYNDSTVFLHVYMLGCLVVVFFFFFFFFFFWREGGGGLHKILKCGMSNRSFESLCPD